MRRSSALVIDREPTGARAALRAWLARIAAGDARLAEPEEARSPGLASSFENRVRALRANAHAAYRSVEGSEGAALDAALAVLEAEWQATRAARDGYAEALKAIRMYARDTETRALAERALRGERRAAAEPSRFPFEDESVG